MTFRLLIIASPFSLFASHCCFCFPLLWFLSHWTPVLPYTSQSSSLLPVVSCCFSHGFSKLPAVNGKQREAKLFFGRRIPSSNTGDNGKLRETNPRSGRQIQYATKGNKGNPGKQRGIKYLFGRRYSLIPRRPREATGTKPIYRVANTQPNHGTQQVATGVKINFQAASSLIQHDKQSSRTQRETRRVFGRGILQHFPRVISKNPNCYACLDNNAHERRA